ncbi:energy-coupling factor transporter transmembrane component T family protein [Staphylococcus simiae]|uniref:Cobalt transport protein n=1 Tax=Staphylococcus simiae CCM 7213 = CCUG 51256 TaxID=911238 RepID=G5JJZ3_9STAP|nr:energy-coupling factor transporter transmembrane component T [Staphylococcus simiae]EHJ07483.1 hypothetical protein SS7213T_09022 [Staphylococcus simiae CCM 7213 = CCUG 51256]PNZ14968.1 energy-coupling factor transporter transmembrane protein EcfT [Staphylococcus simiae]SNV84701.1 Transmembrane component MtsC of energizing module of methionine-regulated ECF transporter [Staphylococcus simiae]
MNDNTLGYHQGNSVIHHINATAKLIFLLCISIAAMTTYDTRYLIVISIISISLFKMSQLKWRQVSFVIKFIGFFTVINIIAVYLFDPEYGVRLYDHRTVLLDGIGRFTVTSQELFYLCNLCLKYVSTVPLALVFLMTTNPSHFAASLNKVGVNYKISYAVALALRYIPDIQETYHNISLAQQARGFEMSSKASLLKRLKGISHIVVPLIFSSLDRIDTISTAMELRQFGHYKKRTWYVGQKFNSIDYGVIVITVILLALAVVCFFINGGRFYNPWQ